MITPAQFIIRKALREAARRHGIDPDLIDAIGYVESRWHADAKNLAGADGARGGAWGATQITDHTARGAGFTGKREDLLSIDVAAEWTMKIMLSRPGGPPRTAEEAGAWWNAGRKTFEELPAANTARTDYVPKLHAALAVVRANPLT